MRLNRGTLLIIVLSIVVIVGAYLFTSNQSNQTAAVTPTPAGGGPLFPDLTADDVISLAVSETTGGAFTRIARESTEADWSVTGPQDAETREQDPEAIATAIDEAVSLSAESSFEADDLAEFGLDAPGFTIEIDTDESLYAVLIGDANPGQTRSYVLVREVAVGDAEAADAENDDTIYLVMRSAIQELTDLIPMPPFMPLPTATATPTATLNPMSEVEQATATAQANATATSIFATVAAEAAATAEVTAEVTAEPTD